MAPSPSALHISALDSATRLFQRLDLIERQHLASKMDYLDLEQMMDVPDTPDRLTAPKRNSAAVANSSGDGELPNRGDINNIRAVRKKSNEGNITMNNFSQSSNCKINDQSNSSISSFAPASVDVSVPGGSQNLLRVEGRACKKPVGCSSKSLLSPMKKPFLVPSATGLLNSHTSDGIIHGSGSSNLNEWSVSTVGIKDENKAKAIGFGPDSRSNVLVPSRGRGSKEVLLRTEVPQMVASIQDNDHAMAVDSLPDHTSRLQSNCFDGTSRNHEHLDMKLGSSFAVPDRDAQGHPHASKTISSSGSNSIQTFGNSKKRVIDGTLSGDILMANSMSRMSKGKEIDLCHTSHESEQLASVPLQKAISPPKSGRRRLVRNGCISPFNIQKNQDSLYYQRKKDVINKDGNDRVACSEPSHEISTQHSHVISPSSEKSRIDRVKGKGVVVDVAQIRSSGRDSLAFSEEDCDMRNVNCVHSGSAEEIGNWKSTRNRSKVTHKLASDGMYSDKCFGSLSSCDLNRGIEIGDKDQVTIVNDSPENSLKKLEDPVSSQYVGLNSCEVQASSSVISELVKENDKNRGKHKRVKKLRKSTSAHPHLGECSTSASDDLEVLHRQSSRQPVNVRSVRTRNSQSRNISGPVILVDELHSPETRHFNTRDAQHCDSNVKARQVEADELLARQLQEQFYNEFPGTESGEIDSSIAWTLQHGENNQHFPVAQSTVFLPRGSSYRNHRSRPSQNSSTRSTNHVRASNSARMAQLRRNFHGRPSLPDNRGSNFPFPPNTNVEMRLDILEALEAAVGNYNGMSRMDPLFHLQRDFNENDYEMLLALDENNHQHVGASEDRIRSLPESIVQTGHLEEACAICLETQSIGDTIRHLPCLHKFHKECIDPWLRRKTSCPVCKCDIP